MDWINEPAGQGAEPRSCLSFVCNTRANDDPCGIHVCLLRCPDYVPPCAYYYGG